jgi:Lipocalin-like domain
MGIARMVERPRESRQATVCSARPHAQAQHRLRAGTRFDPFGGNTIGILMFDRTGYFSIQYSGDARRKVAANDRLKGTPEEDKANSTGTQAYYGTYSVDAEGRTLTLHVERNSFPNWNNIDLKRTITLADDELKFSIPSISTGGATAENVWKRAK